MRMPGNPSLRSCTNRGWSYFAPRRRFTLAPTHWLALDGNVLRFDYSFEAQPKDMDIEAAKEEIRSRNLYVLNPQRAARFIEKLLPVVGTRLSTDQFNIAVEDDLLDFLAVLAFDNGPAPGSRRTVRWRVQPLRAELGTEPARIPRDPQGAHTIERLTLERIS